MAREAVGRISPFSSQFKDNEWQGVKGQTFFGVDRVGLLELGGLMAQIWVIFEKLFCKPFVGKGFCGWFERQGKGNSKCKRGGRGVMQRKATKGKKQRQQPERKGREGGEASFAKVFRTMGTRAKL